MRRESAAKFIACIVAVSSPIAADAQLAIPNSGFEEYSRAGATLIPRTWITGGNGYEVSVDTTQRIEGRASLRSRRTDTTRYVGNLWTFGVASQVHGLPIARGRSFRLTGWIRTEDITDGYAGLWVRVDGDGGRTLLIENMDQSGPRGTTEWTKYSVELPFDSAGVGIAFGVLHPGNGTAWFDSLRIEVFGPAMPRRASWPSPTPPGPGAYRSPPRPAEDFTRLLTDAELAVARDSVLPAVDTAYTQWVQRNAKPIRSIGATDFSDLAFLKPILAGKRIVQLGESGHGVREFNQAKVRLIKYLHESLGYDVIAFESSLYACDRAGRQASAIPSGLALMRSCIFGVWHTEEVVELFDYIKQTQATSRPLILTGFDTQSSSPFDRNRSRFLQSVVSRLDSAYARRVYATDSAADVSNGKADYMKLNETRLVAFYDSLVIWLRDREPQLVRSFANDPAAPALARQVAFSMSQFTRQMAAGTSGRGTLIRDRGMADNLDFVLDVLHPGKKVMVWAHNFHIQHRGFAMGTVNTDSTRGPRTTGTYVAERRRAELYTIGLFMFRGHGALNNRMVYPINPAASGSMEAILHRAPWRYSFVDLAGATRAPGTEWMYRRITAREWGTTAQVIVPREEYDGILFIDRTWPPNYITR
jgi:erythromycin esterase